MKVLVVCGGNSVDGKFIFEVHQSFIYEQMKELKKLGVEFDLYLIEGKGILGYLRNLIPYWRKLLSGRFDLVHAHDGTAGMLAVLRLFIPVIVTFHGSDIYVAKLRIFSLVAMHLSTYNIFVDRKLAAVSRYKRSNYSVSPCGYDYDTFYPMEKNECRRRLGLDPEKKIVVFSASIKTGTPKNSELAKTALGFVRTQLDFMPLVDYSRDQVRELFNAADLLLVTSKRETGPLVVKEAMACNCPIVSTDVGYVREVIEGTDGCFITSFEAHDIASKIEQVLRFGRRTNGAERVAQYSNAYEVKDVLGVYQHIVSKRTKRS
jgi:teichuronic acid biosynthesis glycosyltransferase TuaC